ncbi:P-loop containing nucleoside triphosphate hydrolase protein [Flammula alnicola]|nr:P-loop containing nucleoside triphosphate hydrolase protein [Flammula alnicola]
MFRRNRNSGRQRTTSTSSLPPLQESPTDGKAAISSTDYARKCRDLMELYKDLLDLGAKTIFDLPRVVVIGGQSTGYVHCNLPSSMYLIISQINVPRDSGTCTRCPMVCTMSSNASSWSCTIEIRSEFDKDDRLQTELTKSFGPLIESKALVELWIRRAQAAVLSPHRPSADFLNMTDADLRDNAKKDPEILPFSKNVVQVNVYDPAATDLSFVDLPGLIQNAEEDLIVMVRTLVEGYIGGNNTLIVIAMPMSDDIEMMQAMVLAGNADPDKERTIGVLTKPDTLTKGSIGGREKWQAVLEGRERATKHGYYCVRLPDDDERQRKITSFEAQRNAAHFFDSTSPWSQMADRSRFGIPNFVSNISALLVDLIETNLPALRQAIEIELAKCSQAISELPRLSTLEPSTEIMLRMNAFCNDISYAIRGEKYRSFVQRNRARYLRFKEDIVMTTPDFRPFERENDWGPDLVVSRTEPRWLSDIRNVIKESIGWELPGHVPFEATKILVMQYTDLWPSPSVLCFEDAVGSLNELLEELLRLHFGQYKDLEKYARDLTFQERDRCRHEARYVLDKLLNLEKDPLFTQNFDTLETEGKRWSERYKKMRIPRDYEYIDPPRRPRQPIIYHFPGDSIDPTLDGTLKTWSIEDELKVMTDVQAYFQVASKRIIDYVPLAIEHELNQSFASEIETTLVTNIFKDSEGGKLDVQELLKEDPIINGRRKELGERKVRLLQIKDKLDKFQYATA